MYLSVLRLLYISGLWSINLSQTYHGVSLFDKIGFILLNDGTQASEILFVLNW